MDGIKLLKPRPVAFPLHNFGAIHVGKLYIFPGTFV